MADGFAATHQSREKVLEHPMSTTVFVGGTGLREGANRDMRGGRIIYYRVSWPAGSEQALRRSVRRYSLYGNPQTYL